MERGTELGLKFQHYEKDDIPISDILEQLKRILFSNPNNKKFVITNFGEKLEEILSFEREVCKVDKVLIFKEKMIKIEN